MEFVYLLTKTVVISFCNLEDEDMSLLLLVVYAFLFKLKYCHSCTLCFI